MSVLKTRIILGTAMLLGFCGIVLFDYAFDSDKGLGLVGLLAGGLCLFEFYNIVEKKGFAPFKVSGIVGGVIVFSRALAVDLSGRVETNIYVHIFPYNFLVILCPGS